MAKPSRPQTGGKRRDRTVKRPLCTGHSKQTGLPCKQVAGYATDHVGVGKCKFHGGMTPIKHGLTSTITRSSIGQLTEQHLANPDPLNTLPELAKARALADDFLLRYETFRDALIAWHDSYRANPGDTTVKPVQVLDIADATRILSEITKIVERIERARAANAISRSDFLRVITEFGRVVDAYVKDEPTKMKIKESWLAIRVA